MKIYERIRQLREETGKSQKVTAQLLGYHTTTYQRWEEELCNIKLIDAINLAKYYNVSIDYIAGITDSKKKEW